MKLSTKGRYGVMAMVDLAMNGDGGPVSLKAVAERQGLSESYLEQLAGQLRKAGLVNGIRGAQGGYTLAREAAEITVGDIIRVLEGPIAPVECASEDEGPVQHCANSQGCVAKSVWVKLRDSIAKALDSVSLADLCDEAKHDGGCLPPV